jgi:hypothetical protein
MNLTIPYLMIQRRTKKETPDETIRIGEAIYEEIHGLPPTALVISPGTVYTTCSPELTVVQDSIVPEGVFYFGRTDD